MALRNNPADSAHGGDFYYVVTGNVDDGDGKEETIFREIAEETGIETILSWFMLPLEREFTDNWGRSCHETFFAVFTDQDVTHLSEEHVESEWWEKDGFVRRIRWFGTREELLGLLAEIESRLFLPAPLFSPVTADFAKDHLG